MNQETTSAGWLTRARAVVLVVAFFSVLAALNAFWFAKEFPDEREYWTLAQNLVHSGVLSLDGQMPSAYRPPLLAWLLTPFVAVGATMPIARVGFVGFYALSGTLAALILKSLFPRAKYLPAAGATLVMVNPLYFFAAGNLYPQQVLTPMLLAILFLTFNQPASLKRSVLRALGIGALTALSLLASASSLFSLLPFLLWLTWQDLQSLRQRQFAWAHHALAAGVMIVLALAPYLYRNQTHVHPGLYLSLNSGINLLLGNSPGTTPHSGVDVDLSADQGAGFASLSEFDQNKTLTQAAVRHIRQDPGHYAKLYLQKLWAGFDNAVITVTHGRNAVGTILLWTYMIFLWLGVGLLLLSLFSPNFAPIQPFAGTITLAVWLILSAYFLNLLGYSIFFNRLRFRLPLDVALALLAAAGWYFSYVSVHGRLSGGKNYESRD